VAKLHEEVVVIKVSKLLKDTQDASGITILNQDIIDSLEQVVQELAGAGTLVEIQVA
jgi:hypothetical protein